MTPSYLTPLDLLCESCKYLNIGIFYFMYIYMQLLVVNKGVLSYIFLYATVIWPLRWKLLKAKIMANPKLIFIRSLLSFNYCIRRYRWKELSVPYILTYIQPYPSHRISYKLIKNCMLAKIFYSDHSSSYVCLNTLTIISAKKSWKRCNCKINFPIIRSTKHVHFKDRKH